MIGDCGGEGSSSQGCHEATIRQEGDPYKLLSRRDGLAPSTSPSRQSARYLARAVRGHQANLTCDICSGGTEQRNSEMDCSRQTHEKWTTPDARVLNVILLHEADDEEVEADDEEMEADPEQADDHKLTVEQSTQLDGVLQKRAVVLSVDSGKVSRVNHVINTGSASPH